MKQILVSLLLIIFSNNSYACMMGEPAKLKLFKQFDKNQDNKLSQEEYVESETMRISEALGIDKNTIDDRELLKKRFSDYMDKEKQGFITSDKFIPLSLTKC